MKDEPGDEMGAPDAEYITKAKLRTMLHEGRSAVRPEEMRLRRNRDLSPAMVRRFKSTVEDARYQSQRGERIVCVCIGNLGLEDVPAAPVIALLAVPTYDLAEGCLADLTDHFRVDSVAIMREERGSAGASRERATFEVCVVLHWRRQRLPSFESKCVRFEPFDRATTDRVQWNAVVNSLTDSLKDISYLDFYYSCDERTFQLFAEGMLAVRPFAFSTKPGMESMGCALRVDGCGSLSVSCIHHEIAYVSALVRHSVARFAIQGLRAWHMLPCIVTKDPLCGACARVSSSMRVPISPLTTAATAGRPMCASLRQRVLRAPPTILLQAPVSAHKIATKMCAAVRHERCTKHDQGDYLVIPAVGTHGAADAPRSKGEETRCAASAMASVSSASNDGTGTSGTTMVPKRCAHGSVFSNVHKRIVVRCTVGCRLVFRRTCWRRLGLATRCQKPEACMTPDCWGTVCLVESSWPDPRRPDRPLSCTEWARSAEPDAAPRPSPKVGNGTRARINAHAVPIGMRPISDATHSVPDTVSVVGNAAVHREDHTRTAQVTAAMVTTATTIVVPLGMGHRYRKEANRHDEKPVKRRKPRTRPNKSQRVRMRNGKTLSDRVPADATVSHTGSAVEPGVPIKKCALLDVCPSVSCSAQPHGVIGAQGNEIPLSQTGIEQYPFERILSYAAFPTDNNGACDDQKKQWAEHEPPQGEVLIWGHDWEVEQRRIRSNIVDCN